jgi:hypothetical protein
MDFAPQVGRDETHNGTMCFKKGSPRGANLHTTAPSRHIQTEKSALVEESNKENPPAPTKAKDKEDDAETKGG